MITPETRTGITFCLGMLSVTLFCFLPLCLFGNRLVNTLYSSAIAFAAWSALVVGADWPLQFITIPLIFYGVIFTLDRIVWYFTFQGFFTGTWKVLWGYREQRRQVLLVKEQLKASQQRAYDRAFKRAVLEMKQQILKGTTPDDLKFLRGPTEVLDYTGVKQEALRQIREEL